ncbi:HET-domain-containing protein, partial [Stipitochalara longipes BDJ]
MRLLHASTFKFEEYFGDSIPPYAILSHTWGEQEVTFQDFDLCREKSKIGYQKVFKTCHQALIDNLTYVWVDTCCIDKRNSAELSEAINSMFNWYARSKVCYAYLEDARNFNLKVKRDVKEFGKCRWFSRGWTLQELIIPPEVVFFSGKWIEFGTRQSISSILSKITGIDLKILENPTSERLFGVSIAKRMSWASRRVTTRVEDMAYCLLGLFDVHIPLLYGEGERAFMRLQEEIMRHSHDHSLLAWGRFFNGSDVVSQSNRSGLLAKSPAAFRFSTKIVAFPPRAKAAPPAMTNHGLNIELAIRRTSEF